LRRCYREGVDVGDMSFRSISESYSDAGGWLGYTIVNGMSCEVLFGLARYQWECSGIRESVSLKHEPLLPVHVNKFNIEGYRVSLRISFIVGSVEPEAFHDR
jgi:hypothetical protein